MDSVAPHYGDDYWFLSYHAMALSEDGRLAEARPKIERSVALNPKNAHGAHGFAHVCYESGEPEPAIAQRHRGHPVPPGKRAVRIPKDLRVVMRMQVDKAGRDNAAGGVQNTVGGLPF